MKIEELRRHPAYQALTPEEQASVDARIGDHHLDAEAVAAGTGGLIALEPSDLRFWLASSAERPWAQINLCAQPEQVNALFTALLELAPGLERDTERAEIVDAARDFSRAVVVAEGARFSDGFVRDEQLAALHEQMHRLEDREQAWSPAACIDAIDGVGLAALGDALRVYTRETSGLRGLVHRLRERAQNKSQDLLHGAKFLLRGTPEHEGRYEDGVWSNWTRSYEARPKNFARPRNGSELAKIVAGADKVRVVGGGHSFNDSPLSSDTMISLDAMDRVLEIDRATKRARVEGGIRLRDLNKALAAEGLGLPVLGSTDAQSIAGLASTDLHGTGRDHGFLSEQLLALTLVDAGGKVQTVRRGDPLFHAAIGSIGTCGVIFEVEVQLVDAFNLAKQTIMVDRAQTEAKIDAVLEANEHVSFYYVGGADEGETIRVHRWNRTGEPVDPHWERKKLRSELADFAISAFVPGIAELISDVDEDGVLSDTMAPDERLVMPGGRAFGRKLFYRHDEIEFGVAYERHQACLTEVLELLRERDFFSIVEVRFTPDRSQALIGPGVGRRTAYIELATPLSQDHEEVYAKTEAILRKHGGRPHLGKKCNVTAQDMLEMYGERFVEFQGIRAGQDPGGKFLNAFTTRVFGGS